MKKSSRVLNSSARANNNSSSRSHLHLQVSSSSSQKWSSESSQSQSPLVSDGDGNDVTPLPLSQRKPTLMQSQSRKLLLDEIFCSAGSDHSKSLRVISQSFCRSIIDSYYSPTLDTLQSYPKEAEDLLEQDININLPAPQVLEVPKNKDNVKQHVTEEMLDEFVDILLTETDTISLLDLPSSVVSVDAADAEAVEERNIQYVALCKNRMGNDKYLERSMQTFSEAPKNKQVQSDDIIMADKDTTATVWDIYDSCHEQNVMPEGDEADFPERTMSTRKESEKSSTASSSSSSNNTGISILEMEMCGPDLENIPLTESLRNSLVVMERNVVANIFQPKLAAYRQLPVLEDPDSTATPRSEEQTEEDEESSLSPALERLWDFSCELTRGYNITSMTWNKQNPDVLAVGYGDCDSGSQKPGLICCWTLKNPTWPERVFYCHSRVTSLDFSANNPNQLAVGMYDGTIAIYSVHIQCSEACLADSRDCSNKHLHPVWQVTWSKQELKLSGEDKEVLVSVSGDGRITKWVHFSSDLDCIDLRKFKVSHDSKKLLKKSKTILPLDIPGLCVDFHPTDFGIYLAGTWEGLIHKCSFSNYDHFLDTYQTHLCPVNDIEWSPFSPDVFLSCSSDWTIQLWKQGCSNPVLSFTSSQSVVYTVKWSPNWSTVFAAINEQEVEIWDLSSNIVLPVIVHHAPPDVRLTSLLFATGTDCVLVGDSEGQVTVYKLKNLNVGEGKQVEGLDDIIQSAVSKCLEELKDDS